MSGLKENLGDGYQQVVIGFVTFIAGAAWGGLSAGADMVAADVYWPAVIMLSGAMITLLGTTFGSENEEDRSSDLMDAINDLSSRLDAVLAGKDDSDDE